MKSAALDLAQSHGFHLLPVQPAGKKPLLRSWVEKATNDPATIRTWWDSWPDANVGILTGRKSQLVVVDIDVDNGGLESLDRLRAQIPALPEATVRTGSGGFHIYLRHDFTVPIRNSASRLGSGIDIRGEGGFVVAPPSLHASNNRYEWV